MTASSYPFSLYRSSLRPIIYAVRQNALLSDRWITIVISIILMGTLLSWFYNTFVTHYTVNLFPSLSMTMLLSCLVLWTIGIYLEGVYPYWGGITVSVAFFPLFWVIISIGTAPLLASPFTHRIDNWLLHLDQLLHFNQLTFMASIHSHPLLYRSAKWLYYVSWFYQTNLIAPLIAAFACRRMTRLWLLASLLSLLIGGLFYYFFPALPPVIHLGMNHATSTTPFIRSSYQLVERFFIIHHHLHKPYAGLHVGLVSFPSFHVCQVIINTSLLWWSQYHTTKARWLLIMLSILLTVINIPLILSTIGLGFHYLVDVFGGIALAAFSLWIASSLSSSPSQQYFDKTTIGA